MPAQIDPVFGMNLVQSNGQQQVVDIVAAQVRVAVGRLHLEDPVAQFENGNVEGAAAQVVDSDGAHFGAIQAVGQRRCRGLIDQAQYFKSGHAPRVLGGLALRVVKIGGHGDDRLRHRCAEEPFRIALELAQDVSRNLRWRKLHLAQLNTRDLASLDIVGQPKRK